MDRGAEAAERARRIWATLADTPLIISPNDFDFDVHPWSGIDAALRQSALEALPRCLRRIEGAALCGMFLLRIRCSIYGPIAAQAFLRSDMQSRFLRDPYLGFFAMGTRIAIHASPDHRFDRRAKGRTLVRWIRTAIGPAPDEATIHAVVASIDLSEPPLVDLDSWTPELDRSGD